MPLTREIPAAQKFPFDALGDVLGPAAERLYEVIQAPDGVCAQSVLGGAALAAQMHCNVHIDGREYPISLNLLSIADSGERKSAVDAEALGPHRAFERQLYESHERDVLKFKRDALIYDSSKRNALKKCKTQDEIKDAVEKLGPEPLAPLSPVFIAEEPSYEGLIKLLQIGQPSMGLFSDEGGRLLGGYGMSEDQALKTATGLSELWDGKRISRVRAGEGSSLLYGKRLSMHLMCQPVVAQVLLGNRTFREQGFLPRFLISWPEGMAGKRKYAGTNLADDPALLKYRSRITDILSFPAATKKRNELEPRALRLTDDARALWIESESNIENQLVEDGSLTLIKPFASKASQQTLRIAAVMSIVDSLLSNEIDVACMARAITLTEYYIGEYLRLSSSASVSPDLQLASKLMTWLENESLTQVYLGKIYQFGPAGIREASTAKRIVKILEDHSWLIKESEGMELDGAFRRDVWRVNR